MTYRPTCFVKKNFLSPVCTNSAFRNIIIVLKSSADLSPVDPSNKDQSPEDN